MGTLLLLVGTFSSTLTLLPRAGEWMNDLKKALGLGMLMACVFFVQPFIPYNSDLILHGIIALAGAVLFGYHGTQRRSSLILGIIFLLITLGLILVVFKDYMGL
jgi:thiol:disulfide interchange protein DsbD